MRTMSEIVNDMQISARDSVGDPEASHPYADDLLVEAIQHLAEPRTGQPDQAKVKELLDAYEQVHRWFA